MTIFFLNIYQMIITNFVELITFLLNYHCYILRLICCATKEELNDRQVENL